MSKAMNRSFANVLFGAFGTPTVAAGKAATGLTARSISAEDAAMQLAYASLVIIVPGYGMRWRNPNIRCASWRSRSSRAAGP